MKAFLPPNSSSMTACSSSSLPMALDMFRSVPTDCDIWDNWASWWLTRCSCCRICCWRSSWVELTLECDGEPVVANRLYFVFLVTFGNKLPWPEAEVGLDNDVMSVGTWKYNVRRNSVEHCGYKFIEEKTGILATYLRVFFSLLG